MGLESYLFYIEFKNKIQEQELDNLLESIGLRQVKKEGGNLSDFRSYYYELQTENGITEVHSLFLPNELKINHFSLRFSVSSPTSIIDQTFDFLDKLNGEKPIKVRDTEVYNHEYRLLRKLGKVDDHFEGLSKSEDELIRSKCYIPIDSNEFKVNKKGIMKREILLKDDGDKAVIRGGAETIDHIERKGAFQKFFGWIKKEL